MSATYQGGGVLVQVSLLHQGMELPHPGLLDLENILS